MTFSSFPPSAWRRRSLPWIAGVLLFAVLSGGAEAQKVAPEAREQWKFGVDMANRGLWSEALFRFEQARRIEPDHPKILCNIAVAYEALGLFEEALEHYRQALRLAPRERDVRRNYSRFVEYYQNFKGETAAERTAADDPGGSPGSNPDDNPDGGTEAAPSGDGVGDGGAARDAWNGFCKTACTELP